MLGLGGSAGGQAASQGGKPIFRDGRVIFEIGSARFEIEPRLGGRIVSARVGARELLTGQDMHPENFGSTFWTSPQSDWGWPPVAAIDSYPYCVKSEGAEAGGGCLLESAPVTGGALDGILVRKCLTPDLSGEALDIEYTIVNTGSAPKQVAPWEITRVGPFGLTFFAAEGEPWGVPGRSLPPVTSESRALWFEYTEGVTHHSKLFSDGRGWIAHVTPERLLLVKRFLDISSDEFAPGEAEIEVYASNPPELPAARYVEVENQGKYARLAPGGALHWEVRWILRALPDSFPVNPGSEALVQLVERLIAP